MLSISVQSSESVVCVMLNGRFDTVSSPRFNEEIQILLENEEYLIIDFTACNYLSSSGIRSLMAAARKLAAKGGSLLLTGMSAEVLQVIEITGLNMVFQMFDTIEDAHIQILMLKRKASKCFNAQIGNHFFQFQQFEKQERQAFIWQDRDIAGYDELGISVGIGSPAESLTEDEKNRGLFITIGNCSGFIPFDDKVSPDFRVVHQSASGGIFIHWAVSFGQNPGSMVKLLTPASMELDRLTDTVLQLEARHGTGNLKAMLIADFNDTKASVSLGYLVTEGDYNLRESFMPEHLTGYAPVTGKGNRLLGAKFLLNHLPLLKPDDSVPEYFKHVLSIDNIEGIEPLDLSVQLIAPVAWLFYSDSWVEAGAKRIRVETGEKFDFEPYKAFLARRLYNDSSRIVIRQLHGGYSAQTYQVDSFDNAGRKLRPTVLKVSSRALINREADRCQRFALPYIMNNSAFVLGTAFYGDTGALRYNFVGIGGEQTQLKWLTHYFNTWPVERLEPLFDKIFLQILKPWYGQPVSEKIYPFRDHDPTLTFFPKLCEIAEEILSIRAEDKNITIEETGQKLINPYWFLRHEYKNRRDYSIDYFTSVCHGDLNMQNILLDNELNVYLIDFSETRPRSVISDFARLEAIFMVEKAPLDSKEDMKEMIEFITRFYGINHLDQLPENTWNGRNQEIMSRNIALTTKMRRYSLDCASGDSNIVPYYMAMLEWVLPVVCYTGLPLAFKKLSAYVAGLLCEKLMFLNC